MGDYIYTEPPVEPPEDYYITADCGHEVYDGEETFDWDGKTICPDCLHNKRVEQTDTEWADDIGVEHRTVSKSG